MCVCVFKKKRKRREGRSLAWRRDEEETGEERRGNTESCPPAADSGSFCEAVGGEGVSEGRGWSQHF